MHVEFHERHGMRGGMVEGVWYPSVSSCLDVLHGNSIEYIREEDLERGSRCHAHACGYLKAKQADKPYDVDIEAEDVMRLKPLFHWFDSYVLRILHVEQTLFSRNGFVGTPDAVLEILYRGNRLLIVPDFKFAESIGVRYHDQIEGYAHFPETHRAKRLILQVDKWGDLTPHWTKPKPRAWAAICAAANALQYRGNL